MSVMSTSAVSVVFDNVGGYRTTCTASKQANGNLKISTSVTSSVSVGVSGTAKYYSGGQVITTGNGSGGSMGTDAIITKTSSGIWVELNTTHTVVSSSKTIPTAVWQGLNVIP